MCLDAAAMGAIGTVANMVGSYANYQNQMQQAAYQRQIADRQAEAYLQQSEIARQNAAIENKKAEIDADNGASDIMARKQKARALVAAQRATMGALGLSTQGGSPEAILNDTDFQLNLDIEAMRFNNRKTKWGHDINRINYLNEALMNDSSAANARWVGDASAAMTEYGARNTLLTGISSSLMDYNTKFGGSTTSTKSKTNLKINPTYNRQTGWIGPRQRILQTIPGW